MNTIIVENIYYAIEKANESPLISVKIGYIITAQSLLEALIQREGENITFPIEIIDSREEAIKQIKIKNKEELVHFIEKGISQMKGVLKRGGSLIGSHDLRLIKDDLHAEGAAEATTLLTIVEEEKALLLKVLILTGYDNVSFAKLGRKSQAEKTQFARL